MDRRLKDRVALVTAAIRGIGFACARELAREGARVFLCSRDEGHASGAAAKIHDETGAEVKGLRADVTNNTDIARFIDEAVEHAGRVDICFTNACGPPATVFAAPDADSFRQAFEQHAL